MESRADRRTSHALHTVTTHDHASDRPGYFIGELRISDRPASYRLSDQVCATFIGGAQLHTVDVGSPNLRTRIVDVFDGLTGGPD